VRHGEERPEFTDHEAPGALDLPHLGQWLHLATVYDGAAATVTFYLNGKRIGQSPISHEMKLRIGNAEIGNWGRSVEKSDAPYRNFNGCMDELTLYRAALDANEVKQLYDKGSP